MPDPGRQTQYIISLLLIIHYLLPTIHHSPLTDDSRLTSHVPQKWVLIFLDQKIILERIIQCAHRYSLSGPPEDQDAWVATKLLWIPFLYWLRIHGDGPLY